MNRRGRTFVVGMSLIAALLFYSGVAFAANAPVAPPPPAPPSAGEQFQTVTPQDGSVILNNQLDHSNPEQSTAESVLNIGSGEIQMFSKTFEPPPGWRFVVFAGTGTHVDIAFNPEGFDPERLKDSDAQIKIRMTFHKPVTAATFVMRCEGPMEPPPGGAVTTPHYFAAETTATEESVEISIKATIPATPPRTPRHVGVKGTDLAQGNDSKIFESTEKQAVWTAGHSIVLIRDSATIPLEAILQGTVSGPVQWLVERNANDNNALKAGTAPFPAGELTVNPNTGTLVDLSLDKVGSFSVIAFIDKDKDKQLDLGEPSVRLNVVSVLALPVRSEAADPQSAPHPNIPIDTIPFKYAPIPNTAFLDLNDIGIPPPLDHLSNYASIRFGTTTGEAADYWSVGNPSKSTVELYQNIELYGGGNDGLLGLDRVFSGWCNNLSANDQVGKYGANLDKMSLLAADFDATGTADGDLFVHEYSTKNLLPNEIKPAIDEKHPILDSVGGPILALSDTQPVLRDLSSVVHGGDTVTLSTSRQVVLPRKPAVQIGEIRSIQCWDTPGIAIYLARQDKQNLRRPEDISSFTMNQQFKSHVVLWTGEENGRPKELGSALFSTVGSRSWFIRLEYTVTVFRSEDDNFVTISRPAKLPLPVGLSSFTSFPRAIPAADPRTTLEVCLPVIQLRSNVLDATK